MGPVKIDISKDSRRIDLEGPILVAHQPEFMPWLGFISKATMGDVYFILDNVQYQKEYYQNRNRIRIKNAEGWQWLIIPVQDAKNHLINTRDVKIVNNVIWKKKHLRAIEFSYRKSPFFKDIFPEIEILYSQQEEWLVDFLLPIIRYALFKFDISIPIYLVSDLLRSGYKVGGQKSDLVINLCRVVNAKTFVFGVSGKDYFEKKIFDVAKINPVFQNFVHPIYNQVHGKFIPNMSFIDLLFNYGPQAKDILRKTAWMSI